MGRLIRGCRHRGVQVFLIITLYFLFAPFLPAGIHQGFYTLSLFLKDLLVWLLPLTVSFFLAQAVLSFEKKAPLFIITLLLFEGLSNLASVWYAFAGGHLAVNHLPTVTLPSLHDHFHALWRIPFSKPSWWSADKGTIAGLCLGCIAAFSKKETFKHLIGRGKETMQWILTNVFSRLIPLFVLGFVARMYQTKLLQDMVGRYSLLLVWLVIFLAVYIVFLFFMGSGRLFLKAVKNLLGAGGLAFSSGCSLSTMPWTIEGTAKNLQDPQFAKAVIPATTNIQQIGDCIANAFLCFLIYHHFYGHSPDMMMWIQFSAVFVLARFATAAILGGAIFLMLPIYETYLSFNAEMIAIILAFNVLLDPLITSCNVIANGALCRVFERIWLLLQKPQGQQAKINSEIL